MIIFISISGFLYLKKMFSYSFLVDFYVFLILLIKNNILYFLSAFNLFEKKIVNSNYYNFLLI